MRSLVFLSRVAIFCNLFFIACLLIRFRGVSFGQHSEEFIIIVGWVLAPAICLLVNGWLVAVLLAKKPVTVPVWMRIVNFAFLLLQILFLFLK